MTATGLWCAVMARASHATAITGADRFSAIVVPLVLSLSLLQARLIDLKLPIKVVEDT
jgi:hypothetical protein